jgi:KRAB domain-containing zinc finger protein
MDEVPGGDKVFKCSYCPKSFRQKANAKSHERIHKGEKPHQCPVCNKKFAHVTTLKQHLRRHTGETPYRYGEYGLSF